IRRKRVVNPYPNRRVGIPCRDRPAGRQQTPSEKMKMPRDGAKVRRCSKKASAKRSTIKCARQPGRTKRATNQTHKGLRQPRRKERGFVPPLVAPFRRQV